jgi:GntR family transcriptional regulator
MPHTEAKAEDGTSRSKREWLVSRLKDELKQQKPDTAIERERKLADRFGVSRETVRQALATLQNEGIIYTIHGSGSYVAKKRVTKRLKLLSFSEELISRGMSPASKLLTVSTVDQAPGDNAPAGPFFRIERLRLGDNRPMSLEVCYVSNEVAPDLGEKDLSSSVYEILRNDYGFKIDSAEEHISPIVLNAKQASLLEAKKGEPAFEIIRIALDIRGVEIERSTSIRPGDRYDFAYHVRLEE